MPSFAHDLNKWVEIVKKNRSALQELVETSLRLLSSEDKFTRYMSALKISAIGHVLALESRYVEPFDIECIEDNFTRSNLEITRTLNNFDKTDPNVLKGVLQALSDFFPKSEEDYFFDVSKHLN